MERSTNRFDNMFRQATIPEFLTQRRLPQCAGTQHQKKAASSNVNIDWSQAKPIVRVQSREEWSSIRRCTIASDAPRSSNFWAAEVTATWEVDSWRGTNSVDTSSELISNHTYFTSAGRPAIWRSIDWMCVSDEPMLVWSWPTHANHLCCLP